VRIGLRFEFDALFGRSFDQLMVEPLANLIHQESSLLGGILTYGQAKCQSAIAEF